MTFWIFASAIAILALVAMLWPLLRPKMQTVVRSSYDMQIYKDQLKEVEADLARGTLTEAEAKASRTEVSRRLLAAADAVAGETTSGNAPKGASLLISGITAVAVLAGGYGLYQQIGVPGLPDLPLAERATQRPSQEEVETALAQIDDTDNGLPDITQVDPKHLALVEQLKGVLADRPDDLIGHRMLADNLAQVGKFTEARMAQANVMRILGDTATAEDYSAYAEIMIVAANWYVSPQAETALVKALEADETDPRARYYAGILMMQRQDYQRTYQLWSQLLLDGPDDAPWIPVIKSQIAAVAAEAGIDISATRGPSDADVQAAQDMTADERNDMIRGMVAQLSERLSMEGGPVEDWVKLIRANGILGEMEAATATLHDAQDAFNTDAAATALLTTVASDIGLEAK